MREQIPLPQIPSLEGIELVPYEICFIFSKILFVPF